MPARLRIDQLPKAVADRLRADAGVPKVSRARDTAAGRGRLRCATCKVEVRASQTTSAEQSRHTADTGHLRYEVILAGDGDGG